MKDPLKTTSLAMSRTLGLLREGPALPSRLFRRRMRSSLEDPSWMDTSPHPVLTQNLS